MTYLDYEVFDKAILIGPLFKKLDGRLSYAGSDWTAKQLFKVKCYAQDARDFFKEILIQSLNTTQEYHVDTTCYPSITRLYPSFTKKLGDPFLDICLVPTPDDFNNDSALPPNSATTFNLPGYSVFTLDPELVAGNGSSARNAPGTLDNVEKLVCLILFSEHIISFCDSRWEEVDTTDIDELSLTNGILDDYEDSDCEEDDVNIYQDDTLVKDMEPLFQEGLSISCGSTVGMELGSGGILCTDQRLDALAIMV